MNWNEKFSFLTDLYDNFELSKYKDNIDLIYSLSNDKSPLIRGSVAKICSDGNEHSMLEILLKLSDDINNLVRVEVADSLSSFLDDSSYSKLISMCNDHYYLVRGYAEYGIGIVGNTISRKEHSCKLVQTKLKEERFFFNKINCYAAMYNLGDDTALYDLLKIYHRLKYSDKCAVLNFMMEILSEDNSQIIIPFFEKHVSVGAKSVDFLVDELIKQGADIISGLRKAEYGSEA